jgi:hypothetical protein
MEIRCSSLPTLFACPSGALVPQKTITESGAEARLGWVAHEALAQMVRGQELDVPTLARNRGVPENELDRIVHFGYQAWKQLASQMPEAQTEVSGRAPLPGSEVFVLTGTADVLSKPARLLIDWKTGWRHSDYWPQMLGYAYIYEVPQIAIVWLRDRDIEKRTITPEEMHEFPRKVLAAVQEAGYVWHPGEHCDRCRGRTSCAERAAWGRAGVAALVQQRDQPLDRDHLGRLFPRAQAVKKALAEYERLLREEVEARGPLALAGGEEIALVEVNRRSLDPEKTWPLLSEALGDDQAALAKCVNIAIGATEAQVKAKSEAKFKGKAWASLCVRLQEAGAMTVETVKALKRRKAGAKPPEGEAHV